ncbi:MAG: aerobic cobaltochelatase CobS subunit [Rickettsiaceae bacterium]|jgi:cobaltochelatase CobS|nr:aerobic cobaltochelatase CobS subunit [Rickettsiaceae bacterium]
MTAAKKPVKTLTRTKINCLKTFGFECDFEILGFEEPSDLVPKLDHNYIFDAPTTKAILAGLMFNQKTLLQGMHGTGKSTHIEQVCARLNWPCLRVNFDSQITRLDLVGKDIITLKDGKQITEFKRGIIPFALEKPIALVLDEYDAIRTDVSFVIQRLLEEEGKFALLEENEILSPHQYFRLFATSNTIGMGDDLGIYHGTNLINQAQMDRWNIVATLNYMEEEKEVEVLLKKLPFLAKKSNENVAKMMVKMASLTREGFRNGDLSNLMSLRTLISWGRNFEIFSSIKQAFILSFLNKLIDEEKLILKEYYQRIFGEEI